MKGIRSNNNRLTNRPNHLFAISMLKGLHTQKKRVYVKKDLLILVKKIPRANGSCNTDLCVSQKVNSLNLRMWLERL